MEPPRRWSGLWAPLLLPAIAAAQARTDADLALEGAKDAVRAWLANPVAAETRDRASRELLDAGRPAIAWLGGLLAEAAQARAEPDEGARRRLRALESLTTAVALGFIDRVQKSEMTYAGQYDDLRPLQPHVGRLYLNLLLETPEWFAEQRRVSLIPALRDLYPSSPGDRVLADLRDIAEHDDLEAWDLRLALFAALAQWGDRELVDRHLAELERRAARSDAEDRLEPMRALAEMHHSLRDHAAAARCYRELLRGAEELGATVRPSDYYNAACSFSLSGDLESALDELERCVAVMRSGRVDPSLMLKRELFERDPELANIRETKRFAALLAAGFPENDEKHK